MKKTVIGALIISSFCYAGGDNKVTMTDMKEALGILIDASAKTQAAQESLKIRVDAIEPSIPIITTTKDRVQALTARLNELGVSTSVSQSHAISDEISAFVQANKTILPDGGLR